MRRGTTDGIKIYAKAPVNKFNKNRITARRSLEKSNASMLDRGNPELLSENRRRVANETAAPNVVIYQQFSNYQTFVGRKMNKSSRGGLNQSVGIKEILRNRK